MNALEYLSQAYLLDQQIQSKLHQIEALRSLATTMKAFSGDEPVSHTRNVTSLQDAVVKILEEEAELNAEIDRLVDVRREIREVISRVRDPDLRLLLEKRHLCFESWPQIARDMGHTDRWATTKHMMALEVVRQILERMESG